LRLFCGNIPGDGRVDLAADRRGKTLQGAGVKPTGFLLLALLAMPPGRATTLEEAVADPQLWPTEVAVTAMTKATVIKNGQPAGTMLVGTGKKLAVSGIAADGVTGKLGGTTVKVAIDKTDLMRRLDPAAATAPAAAPAPPAAPVRAPAPTPAAPAGTRSAMQRMFDGKLVRYADGRLQNVEPAALNGVKYYGLYYSASWCGPCRQFTPAFVEAYRGMKQRHPEFEVVFISNDRSAGDMADYMRDDRMPWLAVKFDRREQPMTAYEGRGIPCLVLVDAAGRVLSDSFDGDTYLGPGHVLDEANRILAGGR
jgi:nucleoredoxin